jgi:hypothetical protein
MLSKITTYKVSSILGSFNFLGKCVHQYKQRLYKDYTKSIPLFNGLLIPDFHHIVGNLEE